MKGRGVLCRKWQLYNVLVDLSWLRFGPGVIEQARRARLPVVLAFTPWDRKEIEGRLMPVIEQHPEANLLAFTGRRWRPP